MPALVDIFAANWLVLTFYAGLILVLIVLGLLYAFVPRSTIRTVPGPPSKSWFLGNIRELETSAVGDCESQWAKKYGSSYRLKGGYGEDIFMTSDPKALQFILQTSGYNVLKNPFFLERGRNIVGVSILSTEGSTHKRHRKAMLPAFGFPETKALTRAFQAKATKLVDLWKSMLSAPEKRGFLEMNIHPFIAMATLDAIGEAAFDYDFGVMDNKAGELGQTYRNMLVSLSAFPSWTKVAWSNFNVLLPYPFVRFSFPPTKAVRWMWHTRDVARDTAARLFDEKWSAEDPHQGRRDAMSVLVKSNATDDERSKLSRQEVIGQMGALMLAGHETTANTLSWGLWELAKNQSIQSKLREEIIQYGRDGVVPVVEYDKMEYTVAFIKELFRLNSIVPKVIRGAAKDIFIPLSEPIRTTDGRMINEVFLRKGARIFVNIIGYNRHPHLWGDDPLVFRPERWLGSDITEGKVKFGVYANLGTFGAGIHACIGWRFALYELQSFLIATIQSFRFELPENPPRIRRTFASAMVPQVEGDDKHTAMPLKIVPLNN